MDVNEPYIKIQNFSFSLPLLNGSYKNILKNLNLNINKAERVGIIGKNGSGKTTFLRCLAGIYRPTNGRIIVSGKINTLFNVGVGIFPDQTGLENIHLRAMMEGLTKNERDLYISNVLEFVELGNSIYEPVKTYSAGMSMRLKFATSIFLDTNILLMDEWVGVGDKNFRENAKKSLLNFITKSGIFLIATHNEGLIKSVCNKVLVLEDGQIVFNGEVDEGLKML